jgi:hypothetical protein
VEKPEPAGAAGVVEVAKGTPKTGAAVVGSYTVTPNATKPVKRTVAEKKAGVAPKRAERRLVFSSLTSDGIEGGTQTFFRMGVTQRLELGVAYQWNTQTVRPLANYRLVQQDETWPSITIGQMSDLSFGRQKIFANAERAFELGGTPIVVYAGAAHVYDHHGRLEAIGGMSFQTWKAIWTAQYDGRRPHYGVTVPVLKIDDTPVRFGIMAIRGDRLGPIISSSIPIRF